MASSGKGKGRPTVLILGCAGVGKTLLVRGLSNRANRGGALKMICANIRPKLGHDEDETRVKLDTQPTVGVELESLDAGRFGALILREVGSPMLPMWHAYYKECAVVIYVINLSDRLQISDAAVEFWNMIRSTDLESKDVLILCTHEDMIDTFTVKEVEDCLCLYSLSHRQASVEIMSANLRRKVDCDKVLKWLAAAVWGAGQLAGKIE